MKKLHKMLTSSVLLMISSISMAGTSEVTWTSPDDYRDVDAGEGHRTKFKTKVFKDFEDHFTKLATELPADQTLKINVSDVDLAGDVNFGTTQRVRVVKDLYFPRVKFSYELIDASGNVLKQGEENLKDMNFLSSTGMRYRHDVIRYEKVMLDKWFKKTFQ